MAASLDGMRERWERMNPREQGLLLALSLTFIFCIIALLVFKIQDGMASIEKNNAESRDALAALAQHRNAKELAKSTGTSVSIPEQPKALDTYLEPIISELELTSPTYPKVKEVVKGQFAELSFEITLKNLDIVQLTKFLEKVESSKLIVIKELTIDTNFRNKEKLDLEFTLATYKKISTKKDKDAKGKKGSDDKEEGS